MSDLLRDAQAFMDAYPWLGAGGAALLLTVAVLIYEGLRYAVPRLVEAGVRALAERLGRTPSYRRFERRYREWSSWFHASVPLTGVGALGAHFSDVQLMDVYVPPTFRPYAAERPESGSASQGLATPASLPAGHVLAESRLTAVLGPPGSGKSTLLRRLVVHFGAPTDTSLPRERRIPVFLRLGDVADTGTALPEVLDQCCRAAGLEPPPGFFSDHALKGRAALFLDGLDEVVPTSRRAAVADWVDRAVAAFPDNRWVLSSRVQGWQTVRVRGFRAYIVEPFSGDQVSDFLGKWHQVALRARYPAGAPEHSAAEARREASRLFQEIWESPSLRSVACTPLMLSVVALLRIAHGAAPRRRAPLFERCSAVALEEWDASVGLYGPFDLSYHQKECLLAPVAYWIHQTADYSLQLTAGQRGELLGVLAESTGIDAETLAHGGALHSVLMWIEERSGLIAMSDGGALTYRHRSFQEYFAARHLQLQGLHNEAVARAQDPDWSEVIALYSGLLADSSDLIGGLLDGAAGEPGPEAFVLAAACVDEARRVSQPIRTRLRDELVRETLAGVVQGEVHPDLLPAARRHARSAVTARLRGLLSASETHVPLDAVAAALLRIDPDAGLAEVGERASDELVDTDERSRMIEGLAQYAGGAALPALLDALHVADTRDAAARALTYLGSDGLRQLERILWSEDREERAAALRALGGRRSGAAGSMLVEFLSREPPSDLAEEATGQVRRLAQDALGSGAGEVLSGPRPFGPPDTAYAKWAKRALDLLLAGQAVLVVGPLLMLLGVLVKLTSRGPAFVRQERIGLRGQAFPRLWLRTMTVDAERGTEGPVWVTLDDPAVTPVGRLLRRTRLDELPQLWNVVKGEMSLIGPRPEAPLSVERFGESVPFYRQRLQVRPGITGLAQLRAGDHDGPEDALAKVRIDLAYTRQVSLAIDLRIYARAVWAALLTAPSAWR
jgi:lipopolysaccharide/colanic/teichoic acid biosynthesis glycosyltransferase